MDFEQRRRARRIKRRRARRIRQMALLLLLCALSVSLFLFFRDSPDSVPVLNKVPASDLEPWERFQPYSLPETAPGANLGFQWTSQTEGELGPIHFGMPAYYTDLGITTFRGNNFRNQAAWGTANVTEERLVVRYHFEIGQIENWTGAGWTGQPAIVRWDFALQQQMNLLPDKRDDPHLVEVIYGTLDGHIYFFDLADGTPTRPPIYLGEPIKGGVTVDPRGYPLLYVGQGIQFGEQYGYYIYSLLDGSELFFLNGLDPFAPRDYRGSFDGNPLFDTVNDRMILGGENGIVYSVLLNTAFDPAAPSIRIDPVISRYRHTTDPARPYGIENSVAGFSHYLFFADNSGIIQCVDLKTFEPVWVFDSGDDTDASLVLDWEEEAGRLVIYSGTQVDLQGPGGFAFVRKLDAANGNLLWEHAFPCRHVAHLNGGVLGTPILGKGDISHLVIFSIAKTIDVGGDNLLVAFDRESGAIVWETVMTYYAWSSPVALYTPEGKSYIILCDSLGNVFLIRGLTGEVLYQSSVWVNVEASPAIYDNKIVIGTRGMRIFGLEIL